MVRIICFNRVIKKKYSVMECLFPDYLPVSSAKMSIIVCAKLSQAKQFVRFRAEGGTNLQCIVVIESIDTVDIEAARSDNVDLVSFQDMLVCWAVGWGDTTGLIIDGHKIR